MSARGSSSKRYNRIGLDEPLSPDSSSQADEDNEEKFVLVILDALHRRFRVPASPDWTVARLKREGVSIHNVPASNQRLIYMGKMLLDEDTLKTSGIVQSETIVHLFPKPNMVITSITSSSTNANEEGDDVNEATGRTQPTSTGAHIPQIIMDAEEARRASSMVIFTSAEMFEAQHRVKLLSFVLLFLCSMELLTLMSVLLGVSASDPMYGSDDNIPPGDPTDSAFGDGGNTMPLRTWRKSDYADLAIQAFGFYVATMGIRATTENTLISAKKYFYGLVVMGLAWLSYEFLLDVSLMEQQMAMDQDDDDDIDDEDDGNGDDDDYQDGGVFDDDYHYFHGHTRREIYTRTLIGLSLPIFIWFMCFFRAWQFQSIIQQAEEEAHERSQRFNNEMDNGETPNNNVNEVGANISSDEREPTLNGNGYRGLEENNDSGNAVPLVQNDSNNDLSLEEERTPTIV